MRTIAIWCEHSFQLYSAIPILEKYKKDKIILFTKKTNINAFQSIIKSAHIELIAIEKYQSYFGSLFKKIFELVFVPVNFSIVYEKEFVEKESFFHRLIRKFFFLKLKKRNVNKFYTVLTKSIFRSITIDNFYNIDLVISFTKVYYSYLLPNKEKIPHINIMESWDHPMKFPYYIDPSYTLTWNKDLARDVKEFQHINRVKKIRPLKFNYLYQYGRSENYSLSQEYKSELDKLNGKKVILYPTTTSSAGIMHEGEMKLIGELCEVFRNSRYVLYIKPKPNAPKGDYDEFKGNPNVIIGKYSNNSSGADILSHDYNLFRYLLLKKCECLINSGTTFGLEAAIANIKIIQLNFLKDDHYGFGLWCKTYHLKKYVLSIDGVFDYDQEKKWELISEIEKKDYGFSNKLKAWITHW